MKYDFHAALAGEPTRPIVEDEPETSRGLATEQVPPAPPEPGDAPLNLNLTTGMLIMGNRAGDVEVDTHNESLVLDPASPDALERRGEMFHLVDEAPGTPAELGISESIDTGQHIPMGFTQTISMEPAVPETETGLSESGHGVALELGEDAETVPSVEQHSVREFGPVTAKVEVEPVDAVEEAVAGAASEPPTTGPLVTIDPTTGETVIIAENTKITVGGEDGTIRIEPSEENIPLNPDADPTIIEAGLLRMEIDPVDGTMKVDRVDGESSDITVEVGDIRIVMDPDTGKVHVDPGDGTITVDPETGRLNVSPVGNDTDPDQGPAEGGRERGEQSDGPPPKVEDDKESGPGAEDGDKARSDTDNEDVGGGSEERPASGSNPSESTGGSSAGTTPPPTHSPGTNPNDDESEGDSSDDSTDDTTPHHEKETAASASEDEDAEDANEDDTEGRPTPESNPSESTGGTPVGTTPPPTHSPGTNPNDEGSDDEDEEGSDNKDEDENEDDENEDDEDDEGSGDDKKDKDDEGSGDDKKDKDDEGSSSGGGEGESEGTKIDVPRMRQFQTNFLEPLQLMLEENAANFAQYDQSDSSGQVTLLGNSQYLAEAGDLGGRIDKSMGTLYEILTSLAKEMKEINNQLDRNITEFEILEEDQELTANQIVSLLGSPSSSKTPPPSTS